MVRSRRRWAYLQSSAPWPPPPRARAILAGGRVIELFSNRNLIGNVTPRGRCHDVRRGCHFGLTADGVGHPDLRVPSGGRRWELHDHADTGRAIGRNDVDPRRVPLRRGRRTRLPVGAHARRTRRRSLVDAAVPALADRFTLVFYDHRCNGRSTGAPVTSMTWENLTADAEALRAETRLRAVGRAGPLVRRPRRPRVRAAVSRQPVAPRPARHGRRRPVGAAERGGVLARRGFAPRTVELARRWFNGQIAPTSSSRP